MNITVNVFIITRIFAHIRIFMSKKKAKPTYHAGLALYHFYLGY